MAKVLDTSAGEPIIDWQYAGYEHPEHRICSVEIARLCFLVTLESEAPKVLEELRDDILPLYLSTKLDPYLIDYKNLGGRNWERAEIWTSILQGASWIDEKEITLGRRILAWASHWNLTEQISGRRPHWILGCTMDTLKFWKHSKNKLTQLEWSYVGILWPGLAIKKTPKNFPQWNAHIESRRNYLKNVTKRAKQSLKNDPIFSQVDPSHRASLIRAAENHAFDCSKKIDEKYQSAGWKPIEEKTELQKHVEWTIKYQVQRINFSQIARKSQPRVKPQAVIKAVRSILALIGLNERASSGRGRPRVG